MKKLMLAAVATVALAGPAFAQSNTAGSSDSLTRTQGNNPHLGGDNQQSGGPAQSRATTGGTVTGTTGGVVVGGSTSGGVVTTAPATTGTVRSADPAATADPLARTQGNPDSRGGANTPSFQQGDNQQSGGPANELNTQTGIPGRR